MSAILFDDIVEVAVTKMQTLLDGRSETYTDDVLVANRFVEGQDRMVVIEYAGGPGDVDTIETSFVSANIYCTDEADATDLTRMVRALFAGRGTGTLCDGDPITFTRKNVGPTPIYDKTDRFHFRYLFEVRHRGVNL